jgi:Swiss Army Knife protein, DSP-PTPase phosphatase domain
LPDEIVLPRNFGWLIESKLAGCGRPEIEAEVKGLRSVGVKAIVSLTGTPLNPETIRLFGFDFLHSHISGAPSAFQLSEIIDFIKARIAESKPVLVHCGEGKGRTGTVLAAYLVSEGLNSDDTIRRVRELRPGSIENAEQENAVRLFEKTLRGT